MSEWWKNFITTDGDEFVCWDETQSNEIGRRNTYEEAKNLLFEYAKTLEYDERDRS